MIFRVLKKLDYQFSIRYAAFYLSKFDFSIMSIELDFTDVARRIFYNKLMAPDRDVLTNQRHSFQRGKTKNSDEV